MNDYEPTEYDDQLAQRCAAKRDDLGPRFPPRCTSGS